MLLTVYSFFKKILLNFSSSINLYIMFSSIYGIALEKIGLSLKSIVIFLFYKVMRDKLF